MRDTVKKYGDDYFNFPCKFADFPIGTPFAEANEKDALARY
jgi:hypothetical protein